MGKVNDINNSAYSDYLRQRVEYNDYESLLEATLSGNMKFYPGEMVQARLIELRKELSVEKIKELKKKYLIII